MELESSWRGLGREQESGGDRGWKGKGGIGKALNKGFASKGKLGVALAPRVILDDLLEDGDRYQARSGMKISFHRKESHFLELKSSGLLPLDFRIH